MRGLVKSLALMCLLQDVAHSQLDGVNEFCSDVRRMYTQCGNYGSGGSYTVKQRGKAGPKGEKGEQGSDASIDYETVERMLQQKIENATYELMKMYVEINNVVEQHSSILEGLQRDLNESTVTDCSEVLPGISGKVGFQNRSRPVHRILVAGRRIDASCDLTTDGGGWTASNPVCSAETCCWTRQTLRISLLFNSIQPSTPNPIMWEEGMLIQDSVVQQDWYQFCNIAGCHLSGQMVKACSGRADIDMVSSNFGNWLSALDSGCDIRVIQRRMDGSVNFFRNHSDYVEGFGSVYGEFWIGLQNLYNILKTCKKFQLRIDMEDWGGVKKFAKYSQFSIGGPTDDYLLTVSGFSGSVGDSFSRQNGQKFSTRDHDLDVESGNCAEVYKGGWWYSDCHSSNLNGHFYKGGPHDSYADGINWLSWKGYHYSLKFVEMKIKPVA